MTRRAVDVFIPVFKGVRTTQACIESVLAADNALETNIVVVDDASPDPAMQDLLGRLAAFSRARVLRNGRNLGFPRTVNACFALNPASDAIILNSDTLVFHGWVDRLARAACSSPDIGTVTPFSNNATICSYPRPNQDNPLLHHPGPELLDRLFARANQGVVREIPTGVGFCMYFKRACLDDVGFLDEDAFGHGYGEENDFCLRAERLGWRNVLAADVFVPHAGGASFGARKRPALERNLAVLRRRYPFYGGRIERFLKEDPLWPQRRAVDEALLGLDPGAGGDGGLVLRVCHNLAGGTARRLRDEARELAGRGFRAADLLPAAGRPVGHARLSLHGRPEVSNLIHELPGELDRLLELLRAQGTVHVLFHHFMDHDAEVLDIPERLGVPHSIVVHDYAWFCPRINLLDAGGTYCGEPPIDRCRKCVTLGGDELTLDIDVDELAARSAKLFSSAEWVAAPSRDAAGRIARRFPVRDLRVVPHRDVEVAEPPALPAWDGRGRLRVAVIGGIGRHKGYEVLLACARDAAARDLPLEFRVVGFTSDDAALFSTGRVFITGRYEEEEAQDLLARQGCGAALFLSVWPETWCYALTLAWKAGLPAMGLDMGAVGERIRETGWGWLLPVDASPREINNTLLHALGGNAQACR